MPYYAVAKGHQRGIFRSWDDCKEAVEGYSGSQFRKFPTQAAAEAFLRGSGSTGQGSRPLTIDNFRGVHLSRGNLHRLNQGNVYGNRTSGTSEVYPSQNRYALEYYSLDSESEPDYYERSPPKPQEQVAGRIPRVRQLPSNEQPKRAAVSPRCSPCQGTGVHVDVDPGTLREICHNRRVYIDGACRGNGRDGVPRAGYGVFFTNDDSRNVAVPLSDMEDVYTIKPTNQRAELWAAVHALKQLQVDHMELRKHGGVALPTILYTDSLYARDAVTRWAYRWEENGYKTAHGKPVQNKDLIKAAHDVYNWAIKNNHVWLFEHVRGHLGIYGNEMADKLANRGADLM